MRKAGLLMLLTLLAMPAGFAAEPQKTGRDDWPQWRGPNRDAVSPASPKLLDSWPKEGPRLLWKYGPIPGWAEGGSGSVSVADGKAIFYINWVHFEPRKLITIEYVTEWGWAPEMPADLVKNVEEARLSEARKKLNAGAALDAYIKEFLEKLPPEQVKQFGVAVTNRLKKGGNSWNWKTMEKLGKSLDREFQAPGEVSEVFKDTDIHHNEPLTNEITVLKRKAQHYTDTIICVDAVTGKELWKKEFPGTYATMWGGNFMACGTPAIAVDRCYIAGSQGLYALAVKDGSELWKVPTRYSNSSVLAVNAAVFVLASPSDKPVNAMGGALNAFDAASGKVLWTQPKVSSGWGSSVVPWISEGKTYLIANGDGGTFCLEPEKGAILWQVPGGGSSTAAISGDTMVVHSGKVRAFKLTPQKAEVLWEVAAHGDRFGSPLIYQGSVYFDGAYEWGFGCLDLKTGETKWCQKQQTGHCSSPILADGKLFAVFGTGGHGVTDAVRMYKPTPEKFEELGRFNPVVANCTSPVIANGKLYLRLEDGIGCYDLLGN